MESTPADLGRGSPVVRSAYLINRFDVAFAAGGGWHCECREFVTFSTCVHTREAAGMRSAQAEIQAKLATGRSQFVQSTWRIRTRLSR